MTWSGNELRAQVTKAARGLGYDWGRAKYLGESVLRAERNQIPALTTLLHLRGELDPSQSKLHQIHLSIGIDDPVDAVDLGIALVDRLPILEFANETSFHVIGCPLFLGLLCYGLTGTERALRIGIGAVDCVVQADRIDVRGVLPLRGQCVIVACPNRQGRWDATCRFTVSDADAAILEHYASRVYAPATEASRLAGAGAGLQDND